MSVEIPKTACQAIQRPTLCSLETYLATDRIYQDTLRNIVASAIATQKSPFDPLELPASVVQMLTMLRENVEKARAGYHELLRLQREHEDVRQPPLNPPLK